MFGLLLELPVAAIRGAVNGAIREVAVVVVGKYTVRAIEDYARDAARQR